MSTHTTSDRLRRRSRPSGRPVFPRNARSSRPAPKPIKVLHKCWSDPLYFPAIGDGNEPQKLDSGNVEWFCQMQTPNDILSCSLEFAAFHSLLSPNNNINAGNEKEAKAVITVTVEESPGPIRTLVELRTNVEDTIKLVLDKYIQEGRTPRLYEDAASSSFFDLYVSNFSLESLDRSTTIGAIGSRSFYLRRNNKERQLQLPKENRLHVATTLLTTPQDVFVQGSSRSMVVVSSFITRKFGKFMRRVLRLFKILGCLHFR